MIVLSYFISLITEIQYVKCNWHRGINLCSDHIKATSEISCKEKNNNKNVLFNKTCHLTTISGTIVLAPYHVVKSMKLIWRSGIHRFHLRVPDLQISCSDLPSKILCCRTVVPVNSLRPRKMDAISQTTFSNAFSWMKMFEFRLKFSWSLFPRVQLTIFHQWFR